MEASYYVGIDISKQRLDWQVHDAQNTELATDQAVNTPKGIHKMIGRWKRAEICVDELIVCFEHTGPYGLLLATMLEQSGICYVMVPAAQVQLSLGIRRGKSDPIDAGRLAEYVWRFRDRLQPSRLPSKALFELRGWLLVYTEGFTRFANARQLACFAGSAPFPNQSGKVKNPDRVSEWRCVRLKTLLLNGVHSAIQYDPELRAYYQRKCGEGKHPKSVKNAVVCKLLYRVFAVINRGTPYVKLYEHKTTTIA